MVVNPVVLDLRLARRRDAINAATVVDPDSGVGFNEQKVIDAAARYGGGTPSQSDLAAARAKDVAASAITPSNAEVINRIRAEQQLPPVSGEEIQIQTDQYYRTPEAAAQGAAANPLQYLMDVFIPTAAAAEGATSATDPVTQAIPEWLRNGLNQLVNLGAVQNDFKLHDFHIWYTNQC